MTEIDVATVPCPVREGSSPASSTPARKSQVSPQRVIERLAATAPLIAGELQASRAARSALGSGLRPVGSGWDCASKRVTAANQPSEACFGTFWQIPSQPDGFDVLVGMDIIERFAVKIDERFAVKIDGGICTLRRPQRSVG